MKREEWGTLLVVCTAGRIVISLASGCLGIDFSKGAAVCHRFKDFHLTLSTERVGAVVDSVFFSFQSLQDFLPLFLMYECFISAQSCTPKARETTLKTPYPAVWSSCHLESL